MVRNSKKQNRANYNYSYYRRSGTINIVIRDGNKIIDKFMCNIEDKPLCKKVFSTIMHKYDFFSPEISQDECINSRNDWLNTDNQFFP